VAKKKKTKRDYDEDDDDFDDEVEAAPPKPGADAYTGLVAITTICLLAAAVLFYLDGDKYKDVKAANPNVAPNALVAVKG
jgi:hypothetical protein